MRILTVSAHYPPNFVSGGTLQPQRLSQGLRARGHEVSVYAGWIGDRPPLETWTDADDTGMAVRWVVSSPWIGWADERNWLQSRGHRADFRAHLDEVRPDVVHFHALQSLGRRAAAGGHGRPGPGSWSPCTTSGGCAPASSWSTGTSSPAAWWSRPGCAPARSTWPGAASAAPPWPTLLDVGRPGAGARRPSPSRVLAANGVAPGRLAVDENGLPPRRSGRPAADPTARPRRPTARTRCGCSTPAGPTR